MFQFQECTCSRHKQTLYSTTVQQIFTRRKFLIFSCVKDCITDMSTFTALAKFLSLENYYNTKIAWLGKNFIPQKVLVIHTVYSGTSHNGLSEIRSTSIQRTNNVPLLDFAIETIHFQPLRDGQSPNSRQWTEYVTPKDK